MNVLPMARYRQPEKKQGIEMQKLTQQQCVILTGFTGILHGEFEWFHADLEARLGREVQTSELGYPEFMDECKALYEEDFNGLMPE